MVRFNDQCVCIAVSVWTLMQTFLHVWWILAGRKLFAYDFKIRQKVQLYFYLTYFYNDDKDKLPIENFIRYKNGSATLPSKPETILLDSLLPSYDPDSPLSDNLMFFYFVLDVLWIVASVALLIASLTRIKQCCAIFFYTPWIIIDAATLCLDLFSSIYFGLKIPQIIEEVKGETNLKISPLTIPVEAIMAIVSGRLGIFWLVNLALLILIVKSALSAWKQRYSDEYHRRQKLTNNSEARIRNWQLFYGPLDESDNRSDLSYLSSFKELEEYNKKQRGAEGTSQEDLCSTFKSNSISVASSPPNSEFRGQMPWSYTEDWKVSGKKVVVVAPTLRTIGSLDGGNSMEERTSRL